MHERPALLGLVAAALVVALVAGGATLIATAAAGGGPARSAGRPAALPSGHPPVGRDGPAFAVRARDGAQPVRWDPCTPIRWVFNGAGAPPGARELVRDGLDRVARRTGLRFLFAGRTDEQPAIDRSPYQPDRWPGRWAPVLVAWVSGDAVDLRLEQHDRAIAVPVAVRSSADRRVFVSGQVVFDADRDLAVGFGDRDTHWGATVLHELGHLVGLAHVADPGELMYVRPGSGPAEFGAGDLAGLERLGGQRCLATPDPQPVELAAHGR